MEREIHTDAVALASFPFLALASRATAALNCSAAFNDAGTLVQAPPPLFCRGGAP